MIRRSPTPPYWNDEREGIGKKIGEPIHLSALYRQCVPSSFSRRQGSFPISAGRLALHLTALALTRSPSPHCRAHPSHHGPKKDHAKLQVGLTFFRVGFSLPSLRASLASGPGTHGAPNILGASSPSSSRNAMQVGARDGGSSDLVRWMLKHMEYLPRPRSLMSKKHLFEASRRSCFPSMVINSDFTSRLNAARCILPFPARFSV